MMRSLWTAASGMISQQTNVDTISNNIANINTVGYKKETAEFKSLLYQTIQTNSTDNQGNPKPVGVQVGLGVRNSAITSQFDQGALTETGNSLDLAIKGNGFFMVELADGSIGYTRNGSFISSMVEGGIAISDSDGNPLLDVNGEPIVLDTSVKMSEISIDSAGNIGFKGEDGNVVNTGIRIGISNFSNPAGLEKCGGSIFKQTDASGEAALTTTGTSSIVQGYLESSNVQTVDEMVNLIVAQRAYEMNSKIISASDTMLQQANNLRN